MFPIRFRCWQLLLALLVLPGPAAVVAQAPVQHPIIRRIHATADPKQDSVFRLGSTITLEVFHLNRWLKRQEALLLQQGFDAQKAHEKARNLVLYIDDAPLIGMPPLTVYADETSGAAQAQPATASDGPDELAGLLDDHPVGIPDKVVFRLRRDVSNYRYWNVVYNSPWDFSHPGRIGLGYDDRVFTELYPGQAATIRLELIQPSALWVACLGTLALGLGLLLLATRSWLLRETPTSVNNPEDPAPTVAAAAPPYSLSKLQLAWWTFLIMSSYLVIYCATGEMADISTTTLALLGISAGTTTLNGLIAPAMPLAAATAPPPAAPRSSRGWLTDILSDEHGISIHRLQKVVISVLMGYFFVRSVYETVAMPVWTNNQLLLLAISSATYLGLKWQENRSPDPAAAPAASLPLPAPFPAAPASAYGAAGSLYTPPPPAIPLAGPPPAYYPTQPEPGAADPATPWPPAPADLPMPAPKA